MKLEGLIRREKALGRLAKFVHNLVVLARANGSLWVTIPSIRDDLQGLMHGALRSGASGEEVGGIIETAVEVGQRADSYI